MVSKSPDGHHNSLSVSNIDVNNQFTFQSHPQSSNLFRVSRIIKTQSHHRSPCSHDRSPSSYNRSASSHCKFEDRITNGCLYGDSQYMTIKNQVEDQCKLKIASIMKSYEIKLDKQKETYELAEMRYKQEIELLKKSLSDLTLNRRSKQRETESEDSHCNVCADGQIVTHMKNMLECVEREHANCLQTRKNLSEQIVNLQQKVSITEEECENAQNKYRKARQQIKQLKLHKDNYEREKRQRQRIIRQKQRECQVKEMQLESEISRIRNITILQREARVNQVPVTTSNKNTIVHPDLEEIREEEIELPQPEKYPRNRKYDPERQRIAASKDSYLSAAKDARKARPLSNHSLNMESQQNHQLAYSFFGKGPNTSDPSHSIPTWNSSHKIPAWKTKLHEPNSNYARNRHNKQPLGPSFQEADRINFETFRSQKVIGGNKYKYDI